MPRQIVNEDEVKAAVAAAAAAAGGQVSHNDLVTQFENEGHGTWVGMAIRMAQSGAIKSIMESQENGKAVLKYWVD